MSLEDAIATATTLVKERFPEARAAWLAGSVIAGTATSTSDLDLTVLLDGPPAPYRESVRCAAWPVELFVHTSESVELWLARDLARRRPTLGRLIAGAVRLLGEDDVAGPVERSCRTFLLEGPPPLTQEERDSYRYGLSDQLDDLVDADDSQLRTPVAFAVWESAASLLLCEGGRWLGTGNWLARELAAYDAAFAARLHDGLLAACLGETELLVRTATEVLDRSGGRLWEGYRVGG